MIKIIVVEDFELLREDLCELIEQQPDMEVAGRASSGLEAVCRALETEADIILMDIEMEQVNSGILAAEKIHERHPEQKIIYLTAHETREMILTAMGTGAVDYVVKGGEEEEVLSHIRSAYAGKPVMNAKIHEIIMQEYMRLRFSERSLLFFINNVSQLTVAERELVHLLLEERKIKEIAKIRCVEVITVKTQIKGLLRKFGCSRSKEIVNMIRQLNIGHLF